jgi:phage gp36-like protein
LAYITQQDLEDELGEDKLVQLTDDARNGEIGQQRVNKAISYAVGTFDSYARTRYQIPVPITERVKATCLDLAIFHLYKSRASTDEGVYKIAKHSHDAALKFLGDIQSGKAALDVPSAEETAVNPKNPDEVLRGSSATSSAFSDDKLSGY